MSRRIVYQEIKKIFSDKRVLIFLLFIFLLQMSVFVSDYGKWVDKVKDIKQYNEIADKYSGDINWEIIEDDVIQSLNGDDAWAMELLNGDVYDIWAFDYHCAAARNLDWEKENSKALNGIEAPGYANCSGINLFSQNILGTVSAIAITVLVILMVSPLFTKEKKCGMDTVIASSLAGKRRNTACKMVSVTICVSLFVVVYYITFLLLYVLCFDNVNSLHRNINVIPALYLSPYELSIAAYLMLGLLRLWFGAMTTVTVACVVAARGKNTIGNLLVSCIILFFPIALPRFGFAAKIGSLFPVFAMQGYFCFEQSMDFTVGNSTITYRLMSIIVMVVVNIILLSLLFFKGKQNEKRSHKMGNEESI